MVKGNLSKINMVLKKYNFYLIQFCKLITTIVIIVLNMYLRKPT